MCFPLLHVLWSLRELGLLLTFFLVPVSVLVTRGFTRRYLERGILGGAIAFGLRYLLVGGWLALVIKLFVIGGEISDTPFIVCIGVRLERQSAVLLEHFTAGFGHEERIPSLGTETMPVIAQATSPTLGCLPQATPMPAARRWARGRLGGHDGDHGGGGRAGLVANETWTSEDSRP